MRATPRATWTALVVASLVIVASALGVARRASARVDVRQCQGRLELVPGERTGPWMPSKNPSDVRVRWDDAPIPDDVSADAMYANVRVVWERADGLAACSDLPLPWPRVAARGEKPSNLRIDQEVSGEHYAVHVAYKRILFRKVETATERQVDQSVGVIHVAAVLVLMAAMVALAMAAKRATTATPYLTRMVRWQEGTLRRDRLVEGANGGSAAVVAPGVDLLLGPVLVDPSALAGREVYRALPILEASMIVVGSHAEWDARARNALRTSTAIAAAASTLAGIAYLLAR